MARPLHRRTFLTGAALGLVSPLARRAWAAPRFTADPFSLGVASGSVTPTGVVLWTRLAPEPLNGGGMPDERVEVSWELAEDEGFGRGLRSGRFYAVPELAHSVHAEIEGLRPGRRYFYRFHVGEATSPIGRTRTLPAPDATPDRLRIGYASCQHFEQGYYAAHRHLLAEDLDLMFFLGDYIYESTWGEELVRQHSDQGAVIRTQREYRNRHAQYKLDPDLQRLHGALPWVLTWDDHEVVNDYAGLRSERLEPDFLVRRQAAYQAYWEHMPLRMSQLPNNGHTVIHHSLRFGRLAEIHVLDGRQYKTPQACPKPGMGGGNYVDGCLGIEREERSFLGRAQEVWLREELARASGTWSVLAQQTLVAPVDREPGEGDPIWTDGWDGYPAARRRLLDALAQPTVKNPFIIGGDIHCSVAADLHADPSDPKSPVVASEVCGTSISSQGPSQDRLDSLRPENPHIKAARAERGYVTLEITSRAAVASLRALSDVRDREATVHTPETLAVEAGRRGLEG